MNEPITRAGVGPGGESTAAPHPNDAQTIRGEVEGVGPNAAETMGDDGDGATLDGGRATAEKPSRQVMAGTDMAAAGPATSTMSARSRALVDDGGATGSLTADADGQAIGGGDASASRAGVPAIAGYEILGELGRGGMGVVYRARQVRLDRPCALKMILAGAHADAQAIARFLAEAQAIARLHHPHIVQIYSIGEAGGLPYVELEYLPGGSLDRDLDGTPWHPARAARMVEQLARGIAEAHRTGIVHRDLKPANVLLSVDGTPRITDFGLAKMLGSDSGLTKSEAILGSPSYMAPEQAEGKTKEVGPAADVYALGAILYELLTGRPPFRGATILETLEQVKSAEPVPPSQLVPRLPADVETIVLKCLHKEPARRYAGAEALAEDLRRFGAGEPIVARPIGRVERARLWYRRNRTVATLLGFVVLVLLLGTSISTYFAVRANREKQLGEHRLYLAEMVAALQAWREGRISLVHQYLQAHEPRVPGDPDRRGFEWYYLGRLCQLELRDLGPHPGGVNCLAHSPDGRLLATGGRDYVLRLWDVATGREARAFNGHRRPIQAVAFSPDGRIVASASLDATLILWDVATGRMLRNLRAHDGGVWGVAFSPDGQRVVSAGGDMTAKVWDVAAGRNLLTLRGHTAGINGVACSPDGRAIATAGRDNSVRLWDPNTGSQTRNLRAHAAPVTCVVFSPDGRTLATGGEDRALRFWDADGREARPLLNHPGAVRAAAFSPDGLAVATAGDDNIVRVWDSGGREKLGLRGHMGPILGLSYGKGGRTLASSSSEAHVKIWEAVTSQEFVSEPGPGGFLPDRPIQAAFQPGRRILASAGYTPAAHGRAGRVRIRDAVLGRTSWSSILIDYRADVPLDWLPSMAFSRDGRGLAFQYVRHPIVSSDRIAARFEVSTGRRIPDGSEDAFSTRRLALTPASRYHFVDGNCVVDVPDTDAGLRTLTLRGRSQFPHATAISTRGRFAGSEAGVVTVWDVRSGQEVLMLRGDGRAIGGMAFSDDGLMLASIDEDGSSTIWDATPLTAELAWARAARSIVAFYRAGSSRAAEVEASIRGDPTISEPVRQKSLALAEAHRREGEIREAERVDDEAERLMRALFVEGKSRSAALARLREDRSSNEAIRSRAIDLVESTDEAMWELVGSSEWNTPSVIEHSWAMVQAPGRDLWEYQLALRRVELVCRHLPGNSRLRSTRGVALYRLGEYQQAVDVLNGSGPGNADATGAWRPADLAFLAMAQRRLGKDAEARETLRRLRETMKRPPWAANAEAQGFLREVEAMELEGAAPDRASSR